MEIEIRDTDTLGSALRRQRELLAVTQAKAAAMSGVSHRLWSEVERGTRPNVSLSTVLRMLQTIGLDLSIAERRGPSANNESDRQRR